MFLGLWSVCLAVLEHLRIPCGDVFANQAMPHLMASNSFEILVQSAVLFLILFLSYTISSILEWSRETAVIFFYSNFILLLFLPLSRVFRAECWYIFRIFRRILNPGNQVYFVEVFVADALTSLAKAMSDIGTAFWWFSLFDSQFIYVSKNPDGPAVSRYLIQGAFATLPYYLRARQCKISYDNETDAEIKRNHMLNLLKYCSAFPVIWTAIAQKLIQNSNISPFLSQLKVGFMVLNSAYSFYWDVRMDWGLFGEHAKWLGVRRTTLINSPLAYYFAIVTDFALRFSWFVQYHYKCDVCIFLDATFVFEILEICRRTMWFIFRIEWECISKGLQPSLQGSKKGLVHVV